MNQGVFFGQLVIGPAGSGKSTYCKTMQEMGETLKRNIIIFNLDPAAEYNEFTPDINIQDLITLEDAMEQMQLGPNGALFFCIEYLIQNQSWLEEELNAKVKEDDYMLFDCPGQIELYSDQNVFREFIKSLQNYGFSLISMYMMDVNFITEESKFLSGILQAMAAQIALELPSTTVLTKCDLMADKSKIERYANYFSPDFYDSDEENEYPKVVNGKAVEPKSSIEQNLMIQIKKIISSNDMVSIRQLNLLDEDSVRDLLLEADFAIQYGENLEPNDKMFEEAEKQMDQF